MREADKIKLNLNKIEKLSQDPGKEKHSVLWMQGCPFDCPECLALGAREFKPNQLLCVTEILTLLPLKEIQGIMITGGEPFCQMRGLNSLCRELKKKDLGIIIYSGYSLQSLKDQDEELIFEILDLCDVLIEGLYLKELKRENSWTVSGNQHVHFFSPRYEPVTARQGRE